MIELPIPSDIINIASTAGLRGNTGTSACSAKFAVLLGLAGRKHGSAQTLISRVTALTPNTMATDMALRLKATDSNPEKVMQPKMLA